DYSTTTGAGHGTYNALIKHGTTGNVTKLITPEIDLSSVTSAELSFMHIQRSWSGDIDQLRVYYRTSSEGTWTLLKEYDSAFATWTTEDGIVLPNLSSTYQIAFEFIDKYGYGLGIDDVIIVQGASCPKPKNLNVTTDGETATATWEGTADNYNIDINGTVTNNVTSPYTFNVELSTEYTVKVQANCGGGDFSEWSSPVSFTTDLCMPEDMCSITLALTDSYADSWNGGKMEVVDATTGEIYGTYTIESGGSATYELALCPGTVVNFVYTAGSYGTENGWVIYDPAGEVITEEAGCNSGCDHTNGIQATYTMDCSGCFKPSNLQVSDITTNSATLSWNGNNDSYVLQYRPWNPAGDDIITTGTLTTYTVDLSQYEGTGSVAIRHYDISDMFQLIVDNIEVTNAAGTVVYSQDFEDCGGNMPAEFSNMDLDGDGFTWQIASSFNSNVDGSYGIVSESYNNDYGALTPDNWLILSGIEMGGQMTFQARGQDPAYAAENFAIYVSTENSIVEVPVTATTYNATDLTPNTPYAWQVKGICGDEETSYVSSFFKTKDDMLVFATDGNWNDVANWKDAEGNTAEALPTNDNNVRIDAAATIPAGYVACANKATIGTGSITIQDGGQLKQNAATLRVTMEKEIAGYGENNGNYYFIASPFNGRTLYSESGSFSIVNDMLTGEYDLHAFDAAASDGLEWINYKSESTHLAFQAENGLAGLLYSEGYLYANQEGTTLEFIGTTGKSNNYSESREYTYDANSEDVFNGWVLVGNMFTCNGYVTYSEDATFYKMNGDGFEAFEGGVKLAPGEGAFMKVSASGTITYSSEVPASIPDGSIATEPLPLLPLHGLATNVDANGEEILFAQEGYATYFNSQRNVVLPAGMKAKIVTAGASDGTLTYETIADGSGNLKIVAAGVPMMLQVAPANATQSIIIGLAEASTANIPGNKLQGSDTEVEVTAEPDYYYYKLSYNLQGSEIGWYWGAADGGTFTSGAHKAWLVLPVTSDAPFLGLPGWEDTTGIVPINKGETAENGEWYTLQGLKIGKKPSTAGVYIHNGRKVVIK
ncbi:MAG: hypothetical protein K6D61_04340, partial [Prevotella sp.]|nr:hypothetical protein [Prevotella sp.]